MTRNRAGQVTPFPRHQVSVLDPFGFAPNRWRRRDAGSGPDRSGDVRRRSGLAAESRAATSPFRSGRIGK